MKSIKNKNERLKKKEKTAIIIITTQAKKGKNAIKGLKILWILANKKITKKYQQWMLFKLSISQRLTVKCFKLKLHEESCSVNAISNKYLPLFSG